MPLKHLPKDALPPTLNHIPMTRNDPIEIEPLDLAYTAIEPLPVHRARHIPIEPLLPHRRPPHTHQAHKHPRQEPVRGSHAGARILLVRGQVEEQVGFDEGAVGLVVEDELLVGVAVDILVVEVGVEVRVDLEVGLVLGGEDVLEAGAGGFVALGAFFGQPFGTQEPGGGEGRGPFGEEDVVLEVWRDQVLHLAAEGGECFADFGR